MNDFTKRTESEAKTYELFHNYRRSKEDHHGYVYFIASAFEAMWFCSLSAERVNAVATAMSGAEKLDQEAIQAELTKMVRAKVLRSRQNNTGKRLYEVNY